MIAELENLVRIHQLKKEAFSLPEFQGLVRSGTIRLKDATNNKLSPESQFDLAYNAAHALSLAALRWHGYRSENRYIVFQCLQHTIRLSAVEWRILDIAHRKRNLAEYEGDLDIEKSLLQELICITKAIAKAVTTLKE